MGTPWDTVETTNWQIFADVIFRWFRSLYMKSILWTCVGCSYFDILRPQMPAVFLVNKIIVLVQVHFKMQCYLCVCEFQFINFFLYPDKRHLHSKKFRARTSTILNNDIVNDIEQQYWSGISVKTLNNIVENEQVNNYEQCGPQNMQCKNTFTRWKIDCPIQHTFERWPYQEIFDGWDLF